ncbi:hypothetical protein A1O1_03845 [Capronia coronata CBS 617.96]|uniref:High-affinity nickel-transporter n=1 Tax=Capronia coronata CBS 617.96 TaxID=1182541 RepID=W9YNC5_9EURO|nr:uncharacterized protein A1O1_03845 [Capronia coronata CBS 617.96]EXJ90741.1 hypothetical protein A1O1_03845 [Capronia coronata CBS 617.96]
MAERPSSKWQHQLRLHLQSDRLKRLWGRTYGHLSRVHARIPYLRKVPLSAILIIALLILVNLVVWAICGLILAGEADTHLLTTAALAYTLGLRHALDADHISAIDLMTRRLIATGQRPVTVGTFFSLGHSTIVVVTSIVVAATAAGISSRFDSFGTVGGIIGTSVSAAFLILLGLMNAYILYKLVVQIRKIIRLQPHQEAAEAWKIEGGGCLFRALKKMFRLIDRPWKMYPLGVMFGLGFDTSSEIALLGISSIQGASGTSMWLILIFPVLFTAGMCLVDTTDGALMMSLYVAPMGLGGGRDDDDDKKEDGVDEEGIDQRQIQHRDEDGEHGQGQDMHRDEDRQLFDRYDNDNQQHSNQTNREQGLAATTNPVTTTTEPSVLDDIEGQTHSMHSTTPPVATAPVKDPLTFLYYSIVLTTLTVACAIVIGVIQLLTLILNVATPTGRFWDGVETAGDYYEVIGGSICASFLVFGGLSVLCYKPWRRWVDKERQRLRMTEEERGGSELDDDPCPYTLASSGPGVSRSSRRKHDVEDDDDDDDDGDDRDGDVGPRHGDAELIDFDGKSTVQRISIKAYDDVGESGTARAGGSRSGGQA